MESARNFNGFSLALSVTAKPVPYALRIALDSSLTRHGGDWRCRQRRRSRGNDEYTCEELVNSRPPVDTCARRYDLLLG
jgi:hypothetical protein